MPSCRGFCTRIRTLSSLDRDDFQTFVCYCLLLTSFVALLPPTIVRVVLLNNFGCNSVRLTITSEEGKFQYLDIIMRDFKNQMRLARQYNNMSTLVGASFTSSVCYKVIHAGSSQLDSGVEPTVWSPASSIWLPQATITNKYISNQTDMCRDLTAIPMGLVMWSSFAKAFGCPGNNSQCGITISQLQNLVLNGWSTINYNFTNGGGNLTFRAAAGEPFTSTSGSLSLLWTLQGLLNKTANGDVLKPNEVGNNTAFRAIQQKIGAYFPSDSFFSRLFENFDTLVLHAAFAPENIAVNSRIRGSARFRAKNDTLQFVPLKNAATFFVRHPICVLDIAPWATTESNLIGKAFINYISRQSNLAKLASFGLRPAGFAKSTTSLINGTNGGVPSINETSVGTMAIPPQSVIKSVREEWRSSRRRTWLRVLVDTSANMAQQAGQNRNRWSFIINGLTDFFRALEGSNTYVQFRCFVNTPSECGAQSSDVNGNMTTQFTNKLITQLGKIKLSLSNSVGLYTSFEKTYTDMRGILSQRGEFANTYLILYISHDSTEATAALRKTESTVGKLTTVNGVRSLGIHYFGSDSDTVKFFSDIARDTGGTTREAQTADVASVLKDMQFFL